MNRRSLFATIGATPSSDDLSARASKSTSAREKIRDRYLPNVELTTHEGKKVRFYDDLVKDKIVVINMMYANCEGICPGITMNMAKMQKLLGDRVGKDIFFYSITLKPQQDTPKALKDYAQMHGVKLGAGWTFLTGRPEDIELLRRKLGFVDPDPEVDKDTTNHIGNIRFGNERLRLWSACPGMLRPEALVKSLSYVDRPQDEIGKK